MGLKKVLNTFGMRLLIMSEPDKVVNLRGRFVGIAVLTGIQAINGIIHAFFGSVLLLGNYVPFASPSNAPLIFSFYTLSYGLLTIFFTYLFWKGNRLGWIGTIAVSLFVIIADSLTVLDLLTLLGIIKTAAIGEIPYSLLIIFYLLQNHVRLKYGI